MYKPHDMALVPGMRTPLCSGAMIECLTTFYHGANYQASFTFGDKSCILWQIRKAKPTATQFKEHPANSLTGCPRDISY